MVDGKGTTQTSKQEYSNKKKKKTDVGFGPENEDLSHHPEEFFCIWVWTGQPPCPTEKDSNGLTQALESKSVNPSKELGKGHTLFYYN